ncbi:hypothetical protein RRG08_009750 [Elysia crispata]|uniref:Uncharacterized protein n=1 Tax=Elysia crispata TaxID=231223 RepID=A0AAE0YYJ1_9GAST|nr:hypothetical protein RRG08_009750 [Elysia crispata]
MGLHPDINGEEVEPAQLPTFTTKTRHILLEKRTSNPASIKIGRSRGLNTEQMGSAPHARLKTYVKVLAELVRRSASVTRWHELQRNQVGQRKEHAIRLYKHNSSVTRSAQFRRIISLRDSIAGTHFLSNKSCLKSDRCVLLIHSQLSLSVLLSFSFTES